MISKENQKNRVSSKFELEIPVHEKTTAVELLAQHTGLSKQKIKDAMQKGSVWLTRNGKTDRGTRRLRRAKRELVPGDTISFYYDQKILETPLPTPTLISDEGSYSIWNKPCGMLSQGSKWGDHTALPRWAEQNLQPQRPTFLVHRLDRAANGLILLAHKKKIAAALSTLFQQRKIIKHYRAIVHGDFLDFHNHEDGKNTYKSNRSEENLNSNLEEKLENNLESSETVIEREIDGKHARSIIRFLCYDPKQNRSELEVEIETGRKHQIRRHLSEIGFPIIGDRLYGTQNDPEDLQLTAFFLSFQCPVEQREKQFFLPQTESIPQSF